MDDDLQFRKVKDIPNYVGRKAPRDSQALKAYYAAKEAFPDKIKVEGSTEVMEKFYKTMLQWNKRHKDLGINITKFRDEVYIWIDPSGEVEEVVKSMMDRQNSIESGGVLTAAG